MVLAPDVPLTPDVSATLTPTQDLVMEVLAARDRLDDRWWPFPTRLRPAILGLVDLGLVTTTHGLVENTMRVDITDAGRTAYQQPPRGPKHPAGVPVEMRDIRVGDAIRQVCDDGDGVVTMSELIVHQIHPRHFTAEQGGTVTRWPTGECVWLLLHRPNHPDEETTT